MSTSLLRRLTKLCGRGLRGILFTRPRRLLAAVSEERQFRSLRHTVANQDVLQPVLAEIAAVYATFLFRAPSPQDTDRHLRSLARALPTLEDWQTAVRRGNVRRYLDIRPLKLEMDVVNQCNLRCVMCHFSAEEYYRRKKHEISVEDFERIAEQIFPLCAQVSLSIGTEPLLHGRIGDLAAIAGRYRIPWTYMHTNGLLLTERVIEQLIDARFNQLSISIDAATKETYEKIRVGGQFEKVIANIRAVRQARLRRSSATPHVCFNVVLMRSNIAELPAIVQLAHDLGLSGVAAVHMMHFREAMVDPERESLRHHKDLCNRMLGEAGELAARLGIPAQLPEPFATSGAALGSGRTQSRHRDLAYLPRQYKRIPDPVCPFPQHFVGIDADGSVFPCGWWHGDRPMGNIQTNLFEEIWTTGYEKLRAEHRSGNLRPICETCPTAGTGSVNDPKAFATRHITYLPIVTPGLDRRPAMARAPRN